MEEHPMATIDRLDTERLIALLKDRGPTPPLGRRHASTRQRGRGRPQPIADKDVETANAHVRIGMDARVDSAGVLANPVVTRQVLLDKPILIWQYPNPTPIFVESHIESMNSAAQILVYANSGLNTWFTFHYLWANDSTVPVVVDIETPIILTGDCFAQGRAGVFSGYKTEISLSATLAIMRNTGWGSDPLTGDHQYVPVLQDSQTASISTIKAEGGSIFGGVGRASESFAAEAYSLSCRSLLVPAGATVIFEPTFYVYGSLEGDTIEDIVDIDFSNRGRAVRCPYVALSIQSHE
jgi:hypothetical protein